jgi:osmoprotectant transport system ATP-binding protein
VIELQGLTKRYDGTVAVDGLTLTIPDGETCVLIGPSGCGKTTTLRMINRLLEPTSGRVLIDGTDTETLDPVQLRRRLGYAIQSVGLFPHLTVRENIATVPRLLGWDEARISRRAEELLTLVRLDPAAYLGKYPRQLSGGEAQRVGVARALAADPPVLLMDEPFGAVDPLTRERLQIEFVRIQRELHKTVVFVTHDVDEAIRLADRVAIMRDGRLLQYGTPEDVLDHPADKFVHDFVGADRALKRLVRVRVTDVLAPAPRIREGQPLSTAEPEVTDGRMFVYVVDAEGRLVGWVDGRTLAQGGSVEEATTRVDPAEASVPEDATLKEALSAMLGLGFRHIPVVDPAQRLLGEVGFDEVDRVLADSDARREREGVDSGERT